MSGPEKNNPMKKLILPSHPEGSKRKFSPAHSGANPSPAPTNLPQCLKGAHPRAPQGQGLLVLPLLDRLWALEDTLTFF